MTDVPPSNERPIELGPSSLTLDRLPAPLHAGAVHYFRLARAAWQPALESLYALGVRYVDTAVPWSIHESTPGTFDFGEDNPRLDVVLFIREAARLGLRSIVRVGPAIDAELTFDGIPERVIWDEACMARTRTGAPLVVGSLPVAYPASSRASRAFHEHAAVFLRSVAQRLAPLAEPGGPLAAVIVGDEHRAAAVSPGISGGDYHPDAIAQFRRFLKHRYGTIGAVRRAHGSDAVSFDALEPPRDAPPADPDRLGAHLDWADMQDVIMEGAFYRYRTVLDRHGLATVTKIYEQPAVLPAPAADPARLERLAHGVSFECRGDASEAGRRSIARQVTLAAERAAARGTPAFASKVLSGFAADGAPRSDDDNLFVAMTALAYGARGLGLHMAVQRDRWIGGPIDVRGRPRPFAERWTKLFAALARVRHWELRRPTQVRIALPRNLERLSRLSNAFAPFTPALFGAHAIALALEGELDPSRGAAAEAEQFVTTLERVLDRARIPFAFAPAEALERSLDGNAWTIVVCPGALAPSLVSAIAQHVHMSGKVSVGPRAPERDALFAPTPSRLPAALEPKVPLILPRGPATLTELVSTTLDDLGFSPLTAEPDAVRTTLHVDHAGRPRALFVINPSDEETSADVVAPGASSARDAFSGDVVPMTDSHLSLTVARRSVRLLALDSTL